MPALLPRTEHRTVLSTAVVPVGDFKWLLLLLWYPQKVMRLSEVGLTPAPLGLCFRSGLRRWKTRYIVRKAKKSAGFDPGKLGPSPGKPCAVRYFLERILTIEFGRIRR